MTTRRILPFTLTVALTVVLGACGAATSPGGGAGSGATLDTGGGGSNPPPVSSGPGSTLAAASSGAVTGHVGDKLTFVGSLGESFDATLVKVFDPATPTSADTQPLPSGARWVGIEMTIDNHSSQAGNELLTEDGTASDGSILTTLDVYQSFSRPIGAFQGCTDTSDTGQDVPFTSCQSFVVPDGQTLVKVGFNIAQLGTSDQATWTVP